MQWLYHATLDATLREGMYEPASLARDGFIHASFAGTIVESVRLYFSEPERVVVLQIDPRLLKSPVEVVATPRGPMPHILGPVNREAIVAAHPVSALGSLPSVLE